MLLFSILLLCLNPKPFVFTYRESARVHEGELEALREEVARLTGGLARAEGEARAAEQAGELTIAEANRKLLAGEAEAAEAAAQAMRLAETVSELQVRGV